MFKNISYAITAFMIIMCLILAYFFAFTDLAAEQIKNPKRAILITMLVVYAVYRSYRLYVTFQKARKEDEEF